MAAQFLKGDQGIQISHAVGSTFTITYNNGPPRAVPLERATVPALPGTRSPARLTRARSGVVPFAARKGLRDGLLHWLKAEAPFAGAVIGGAGGTGKTRLAVELCNWAEGEGWLTGMLAPIEDPASLEALAEAPIPRLVAVDYAEWRAAQLQALLPLLASRGTPEAPVRVLLLVRAGPRRTTDWAESLRNQGDLLDNLLDQCDTHVLEDSPLQAEERAALFEAAAGAFAARLGAEPPPTPANLHSPDFASPLLVVLAAYLATQGDRAPNTREELLRAVLSHEERYWRSSSESLFGDDKQRRQVIALTTLLSADSEAKALKLLALLPDFSEVSSERLALVARWAAGQCPGEGWWNPLEPDLIGEQLVADEFSEQPELLSAALARETPSDLIRPLEVLGRAAPNHPGLAAALQPILSRELGRLCELAVAQGRGEVDHDLLYGRAMTLAAVLEKAVAAIEVDRDSLDLALGVIPQRFDLLLSSLALTLNLRLVEHERRLAEGNPAVHEPHLASALNSLSNCLADVGRREEALGSSEESVEVYRRLAQVSPAAHEPALASALNNLSNCLADAGRSEEALETIEEAVQIRRRLAQASPVAFEPVLALALNNLSNRLAEVGRREVALETIEEAVQIRRRLAQVSPAAHEPALAAALNNLSNCLADVGRREEALGPSEESVEIRRRLAQASPAAHEPVLALALNNLSNRLADVGRREEALGPSEESVQIRRRLAQASPAAFEPVLALALNNRSNRLADVGRSEEALETIEEAVEIYRRLAASQPAAFKRHLAGMLENLAASLGEADRHAEAERAAREAAALREGSR